mgnify:CR=1 FL=1
MKKRQSFAKEFKLEAVRLLECGDKPAAEIARELGIRRNKLYKWQEQLRRDLRCQEPYSRIRGRFFS